MVTNQYFGRGLGDDATETRPVKWYRQIEDKIIDGRIVRKDRPLYEPNSFPSAYLIQSVGVGSTSIFIDTANHSFNPENENPIDRNFQKDIQIINASHEGEFLAAGVHLPVLLFLLSATISSIEIFDGGEYICCLHSYNTTTCKYW